MTPGDPPRYCRCTYFIGATTSPPVHQVSCIMYHACGHWGNSNISSLRPFIQYWLFTRSIRPSLPIVFQKYSERTGIYHTIDCYVMTLIGRVMSRSSRYKVLHALLISYLITHAHFSNSPGSRGLQVGGPTTHRVLSVPTLCAFISHSLPFRDLHRRRHHGQPPSVVGLY